MAAKRTKSRKRYSGKPERLRLNTFVLYLDENLCNCQEIIAVLDELRVRYKRHLAIYPAGTRDPVFLPEIGRKGWTLLTCDDNMRSRGLEKHAILRHRVRMFAFTSGALSGLAMSRILRLALPRMRSLVKSQRPPFIASITGSGAVHVRFDAEGRTHQRKPALAD
jgi:hypothetical protein